MKNDFTLTAVPEDFYISVRHFSKMDKTVRLTLQFHNSPDDCCFFLSFALSVQTSTKADASK